MQHWPLGSGVLPAGQHWPSFPGTGTGCGGQGSFPPWQEPVTGSGVVPGGQQPPVTGLGTVPAGQQLPGGVGGQGWGFGP
jgi:hypothetical protein